jgi:RNA polymerase sigma factor (sigma-70 family)
LIPNGFQYPHALDAPLYKAKHERLNREILNSLKKEDVLAIMFAEGGAMGCPGEMQLVTEKTIYYANVFFKDNEVNIDMIIDQLFENDSSKLIDYITLKDALLNLEEEYRVIIKKRYYDDLTQMEIAKEFNVSQAQISRIEKEAINKLRKYF